MYRRWSSEIVSAAQIRTSVVSLTIVTTAMALCFFTTLRSLAFSWLSAAALSSFRTSMRRLVDSCKVGTHIRYGYWFQFFGVWLRTWTTTNGSRLGIHSRLARLIEYIGYDLTLVSG